MIWFYLVMGFEGLLMMMLVNMILERGGEDDE